MNPGGINTVVLGILGKELCEGHHCEVAARTNIKGAYFKTMRHKISVSEELDISV